LHIDVERIEPLSTVGAGDTFNAGILYGLYKREVTIRNLSKLSEADWKGILETAAGFSREVCLSYDNYVERRDRL
jgi:fructokinase